MSTEETRYRFGRLEARQIPDWEPLNTDPTFCRMPDDETTPTWSEMLSALGFESVEEAEEYVRHLGLDGPV